MTWDAEWVPFLIGIVAVLCLMCGFIAVCAVKLGAEADANLHRAIDAERELDRIDPPRPVVRSHVHKIPIRKER